MACLTAGCGDATHTFPEPDGRSSLDSWRRMDAGSRRFQANHFRLPFSPKVCLKAKYLRSLPRRLAEQLPRGFCRSGPLNVVLSSLPIAILKLYGILQATNIPVSFCMCA